MEVRVTDNVNKAQVVLKYFTACRIILPPYKKDRPLLTDDECVRLAKSNIYSYGYIRATFPDVTYLKMMGIDPEDLDN